MKQIGIVFALTLMACATITAVHKKELATFSAEQAGCVELNKPDVTKIDKCRKEVNDRWCAKWKEDLDGGVCP